MNENSKSTSTDVRFNPGDIEHLDRALDLYAQVEAARSDTWTMSAEEERLTCCLWVCKARALLEEGPNESDRRACLWVLRVVRSISKDRFFVYGLSRAHTGGWRALARQAERDLRRERSFRSPPGRRQPARSSSRLSIPLPNLSGGLLLVIGGEADDAVLAYFGDADFTLEWIPSNVRLVQSAVARIRHGRVDGVVFLVDLNSHSNFDMVREACSSRGTPLVTGTKGAAA